VKVTTPLTEKLERARAIARSYVQLAKMWLTTK